MGRKHLSGLIMRAESGTSISASVGGEFARALEQLTFRKRKRIWQD